MERKKVALPPYLLRAMENLELACAVKGLICCGCLINKAVVYLLTLPCNNCKRVSDTHDFSPSPSTVKQMFCWLLLKRTDQNPNPPSSGTLREAKIERVSLSTRTTPSFFFCCMGEHIDVRVWKPHCGIGLFWVKTHNLFSLAAYKGWRGSS